MVQFYFLTQPTINLKDNTLLTKDFFDFKPEGSNPLPREALFLKVWIYGFKKQKKNVFISLFDYSVAVTQIIRGIYLPLLQTSKNQSHIQGLLPVWNVIIKIKNCKSQFELHSSWLQFNFSELTENKFFWVNRK